ncbi:MAG TPA: ATP-grasp domain-containing protein [Myxococcaceae bacterium]|nr:ATP-grasp domain-containing protein [Myxococcaceae bacterium]
MNDVVILFGGVSDERRVSVASAQNLSLHLPNAELWFQTVDGAVSPCTPERLAAHADPFTRELSLSEAPLWPALPVALDDPRAAGRVFVLAFHGGDGEDGTVQREFERRGLAFTGSGSKACADAMNKATAKALARKAGIRVVESMPLPMESTEAVFETLEAFRLRHGKVVAKPLAGGSSIGLHIVGDTGGVRRAASEIAGKAGLEYLAEAFVEGTELTVGVVDGDGGPRALPCSEVRTETGRAFDYEGKYLGLGTRELTPAQVSREVATATQAAAVQVHQALGCFGYSRTDFIVGREGPVFLELNTLPGLSRMSFIPQQLAAADVTLRAFLEGQLVLARRRPST